MRVADHELALAFTAALRDVEAHPPDLSPEAREIQDRLVKSQALLDSDQQRVTQLSAALAAATGRKKMHCSDELELAQSQLDLDKDEVEEANQDLLAAGGNPQQRIEAMVQEHDAQVKARAAAPAPAASVPARTGRRHEADPRVAGIAARTAAARRRRRRRPAKGASVERAAHVARRELGGNQGRNRRTRAPYQERQSCRQPRLIRAHAAHSHEDAAALLNQTKLITANQKLLTLLDRQTADQRQLAGIYRQWVGVLALQAKCALAHRLLLDGAIVALILLALLLLDTWVEHLLERPKLDRRQSRNAAQHDSNEPARAGRAWSSC